MSNIHPAVLFMKPAGAAKTASLAAAAAPWAPNTDLYLAEEGLVIKVELAGLRRDDLDIVVEGNRIIVSGQRSDSCRGANCRFLMMAINYGQFESVIEVPPGYDLSKARAAYQNGFLRVDVPVVGAPEIEAAKVLRNGES